MSSIAINPLHRPAATPAPWSLSGSEQGVPVARFGLERRADPGLTAALADAYAEAGALILRALIPPACCQELKREAAEVLARESPGATVHVGLSVRSRRYRDLHADGRLIAALAPLMPAGIAFLSDKAVFKSAQQRFATPLHIDAFYWPGTRPKLSVWLALDAADAQNGGLAVVPGSHRSTWPAVEADAAGTNGEFGRVLAKDDRLVSVAPALGEGDAIIFSDRLVHGSRPNLRGSDRWSAILTYHAPAPEEEFDRSFTARRAILPAGRT